ncbi:uncharacterized protein [Clytia hemisphaerica]|uniref:IRF tryptophan pentad repeat domain-containing protein n=1 Tax=Clytia hemisphaerica TaxID=252671 RepID=A0A7M5V4L4_9CNID
MSTTDAAEAITTTTDTEGVAEEEQLCPVLAANSSPNLFRLSLPEWLKEQVDSGKHKGVYWIDRKEKIFHVPWKHASRNGWEDGDVSLFKAWAIYTNRYREGVDKARPALWKTNFRCAINSHSSITFLKDQGQRKGDKAHRIMQLVEAPKKGRRPLNSNEVTTDNDSPRKLVRLTYPNFGPPPPDGVPIERGRYKKAAEKAAAAKAKAQSKICNGCAFIRIQMQDALKIYEDLHNEEEENVDFQSLKEMFSALNNTNEHLCHNEDLKELMEKNLIATKENPEELPKPNLQDLYFIGKALQSAERNETLKVAIKVESTEQMEIVDSTYDTTENDTDIIHIVTMSEDQALEKTMTGTEPEEKDESFEGKEQQDDEVEVQDAAAIEVIDQDPEDEEDLITPRN